MAARIVASFRMPFAFLVIAGVLCRSAVAQEFPVGPPPPPIREAPKPVTPARITVSGPGPYIPLLRPVIVRMVSSLPERVPPGPMVAGIDLMGISYGEVPLPEKIALALRATGPATSPEAAGVLQAASRLCSKFLKVDLPTPESSATFTHNGEDVAIALWRSAPSSALSPVLLWDEPVSSSLVLSIPPVALQDPNRLEELVTGLFVWGADESKVVGLELVAPPRADGEVLRGSAAFHRFYQKYVGPQITVSGYAGYGVAWLSVTLAKLGGGFDKDMVSIAERFPPLRTRVPQWTTTQLLAAVGRGGRAQTEHTSAYARESVLLHELIPRQDLTPENFRSLIERSGTRPTIGRYVPEALRVAAQVDGGSRFIPVILEYFKELSAQQPNRTDFLASEFVGVLVSAKREGFCEIAVDFLNAGLAIRASRDYADKFCSSNQREHLR